MISTAFNVLVGMIGGTLLFLLGFRCGKAEEQSKFAKDIFDDFNNISFRLKNDETSKTEKMDDFQQDLHNILMYTGEKNHYE